MTKRKIHDEELQYFNSSSNIVRVNKSRWTGYVARVEEGKGRRQERTWECQA
jgi:hypothetical protein